MAVELPEALKLATQMNDELVGKTIARVHLRDCDSLVRQGFVNLHEVDVANKTISSVAAKGKWILVKLEPDMYLLCALETGGKILYHPDEASSPDKYNVRFDFADGSFLTERIVGWGWAKAVREDELESHRYPGKIGVSPVDSEAFSFQRFCDIFDGYGKKAVKYILLRHEEIAGIGNGYLQDILFRAKVHPKRKAGEMSEEERMLLYTAIVETLNEAVRLGGRDTEYDLFGNPGGYRAMLGKHMKRQPCPECGTLIEKLSVLGSSCYVCPSCQK